MGPFHCSCAPRNGISAKGKLPKTVMIGHDVRGARVRPTVLDDRSGMSGKVCGEEVLESWTLSWAAAIAGELSLLVMDKEGAIIPRR